MDSSKKHDRVHPLLDANPISQLMFWWIYDLFRRGTKKDLEVDDLYNNLPRDKSSDLGDKLEKHWLNEVTRSEGRDKKPSLLRAILRTFRWTFMVQGLLCLIYACVLRVAQPIFLGLLVEYFEPDSITTKSCAYLYAGGVIGSGVLMFFINHHATLALQAIGMRMRIACCSLVYRKILRLSRASLNQTAAGHVVNLLSNDVNRFDLVLMWLHYVWILPLQTAICTYFIYQLVGMAAFIGVGILFLQTVPVQSYMSRLTTQLRLKIATRTDERVRLMSEIISGIQVIKMYAWEKPFEKMVSTARRREIETLTKAAYLKGMYLAFMVFSERLSLFVTLVAYTLLGNTISADKVFAMAQFFNVLQCTMAIYYPQAVQVAAETKVSISRLQAFLMQEENATIADADAKGKSDSANGVELKSPEGISLVNATASWSPTAIVPTLSKINLRVEPGSLCAVIGPVGSGKSSLIQTLLHELPLNAGSMSISGTISYASQEAWMFVGTVRDNILFGQPFEARRYRDVCKACALETDFDQLSHGDRTVVGERGVAMSGGQRARINLARAVYREADVYLLDDPLSAVDTHVGKHLFDDCISGYLKKKTVLLVTHQLQYLRTSDLIVILDNGRIENQGSYDELLAGKTSFSHMLSSQEEEEEGDARKPRKRIDSESSTNQTVSLDGDNVSSLDEEVNGEFVSKGNLRSSLYKEYFTAGASCLTLFALLVVLAIGQVASSGADFWVTYWTKVEERRLHESSLPSWNASAQEENTTETWPFNSTSWENVTGVSGAGRGAGSMLSTENCIYIYAVFIAGSIVITSVRSLWFMKICMNASRGLHDSMFNSIVRATMRFFDTNPSGRVLNRFSKDMGAVDELLPRAMIDSIQIFLVMIGILVMVVVVNYWFLVPMFLVGLLFAKVRSIYLSSAQDLKRLEGVTRSPVFSHLSASLNGLTTIRASRAQQMVRLEFDAHQDAHTAAWYLTIAASTAFGFWLDFLSNVFVACVTLSFLVMNTDTYGSDVGLAISQSLILTGMLQYGIRQTAEVVSQMTSVERVLDYTAIEKEPDFESEPGGGPRDDWPAEGGVDFDHLYLRYAANQPHVLRDLNFNILPAHKVGIVGRTGAGKSSLISALFRLAPLEGAVRIDDVDTQRIGLHDLRSRISIIPQEPVLFSATLRYNLDPFGLYQDHVLWGALEEVELKDSVSDLDMAVNQGGTNLSAGQRQLVCLARAIVRDNKVLVLDEATANVDPQTDALIQATIRRKFNNCTVLTIAHRLNTIMDSDRVLVMDAGTMVEYDHPHTLLQNEDGYFYKMLQETGRSMAEQLQLVASQAYAKTQPTEAGDVTRL